MTDIELKNRSKSLIAQVKVLNTKYDEIKKINGENFNIFSILQIESDEVKTHSNFIFNLLNPKGSHDRGDIFLKLFLQKTLTPEEYKTMGSVKEVKREDPTNEKRRIDFTIETEKLFIAIEMKIHASDQDGQLADYYQYINNKKDKTKLFYLTIEGDEACEKSSKSLKVDEDYYRISFQYHIYTWLEECIEKSATVPVIREGLVHYKNLIQKLTNQISDKKGAEMEDILKTPRDLEAANTILQEYPKIWAKKEVEFWESLKDNIKCNWDTNFITYESDNSNSIDFKLIAEYRQKKNDWFGLSLNKVVENFTFSCDVYKMNKGDHIIIDFSLSKNGRQLKLANIEDLLIDTGFKHRTGKNIRYMPLKQSIKFFGDGEPTYELFDQKKFNELVIETAQEVESCIKKIQNQEKNFIAAYTK